MGGASDRERRIRRATMVREVLERPTLRGVVLLVDAAPTVVAVALLELLRLKEVSMRWKSDFRETRASGWSLRVARFDIRF